jgi:CRP-like cAMP-binding protein
VFPCSASCLFLLEFNEADDHTQVQEMRRRGELLGETSFFFRLHHINTAVAAEGSTTLFVLLYDDYHQLSSAYVKDAAAVMDTIIDLVSDSGKAGKSQGSAASGNSTNEDQGAPHASA